MRFAEAGLKGDTKAAGFLLQRYDMEETGNEHARHATTQDEQEFIKAYHAKHTLRQKVNRNDDARASVSRRDLADEL